MESDSTPRTSCRVTKASSSSHWGKQVAAPLARTNGQFMKASGASASTAFVSAIVSIIMAEAPIGNPASSAAKTILRHRRLADKRRDVLHSADGDELGDGVRGRA